MKKEINVKLPAYVIDQLIDKARAWDYPIDDLSETLEEILYIYFNI